METRDVFALGLGLESPWRLSGQRLDMEKRPHKLHLEVVCERGALFPCPDKLYNKRWCGYLMLRSVSSIKHANLRTMSLDAFQMANRG
jgi:hypothetical protein